MKILVTGGAGFIGSSMIKLAIKRKYQIINVDALTYASSISSLDIVSDNPNYFFENIDIRDRLALKEAFEKHSPEAVMHLAAESHVDRSIAGPIDFIQTNILGTFNLLEVARNFWEGNNRPKNFRFHHVSTDEVYGSLPDDPSQKFKETSPYDPRSPYSASKASSDHLVNAWHETYGLPTIITNCSNNYGPFQFPEKLVPVVISKALSGDPLPIYGDGSNIRDWLFVEDHADALILVLEKGEIGRSYNIGSENEITNINLVKMLCSILDELRPKNSGSYSDQISFISDRPGHDSRYAIDPDRIKNELGWSPSITLKEGLEKTVRWYLDNEDWWKALLEKSEAQEGLQRT